MYRVSRKQKQKTIDESVSEINRGFESRRLVRSLEENVATLRELFTDVDVLRIHHIKNNHDPSRAFCLAYSDGMVNAMMINESIIKPLMLSRAASAGRLIDTLIGQVLQISESKKTDSVKDIVEAVCYGDTVLFANGAAEAVILNTKGFAVRSITEPDNEKILSGPREGFSETLMTNLSLIRRRVRSNALKTKFCRFGKRTETQACVCYIEGLVNKKILAALYRRLEIIDIDAVLDTNYITELIREARFSPFRATGYTERPDTVIAKLLEGRIAVFVDGTPVVITLPYLFIENFQSGEDYYLNYYYTSFSRFLRMLGFFLTVIVPGFYIAVEAFHHEMLPTQLMISIATERQSVPLPAALECFVMIIVFDILRETGVRMPTAIGQALSIVGALVIGQAAVEARLVAAPMIIVVAMTGITSLLVPKMNAPVIYIRGFLLLLSTLFGFYGLMFGISIAVVHVINLRSFGVPQVMLSGRLAFQDVKDTFFRAPWWKMLLRPRMITADRTRMKNGGGDG